MSENQEKFESALRATGRSGIDNVIKGLTELGFYQAPASTTFHGCEPGGLLKHSLNVNVEARLLREVQLKIRPDLEGRLPEDSVTIAALLHDVCKAEIYREVEKRRRNANGGWETYRGYDIDHTMLPIGHGEKSVIRLLRWGLDLTDDEMLAIRWHMHAWDLADSPEARGSFGTACDRCPLLAILIAADGLAAKLLEV